MASDREAAGSLVCGCVDTRKDPLRVLDYARGLVEDGCLSRIYEQILGRLAAFDRAEGAELVPTLDEYLACGGSTQRAAAAMGIHRNTVLYRLKRIEELVEVDLADGEVRFLVQLALRAHRQVTAGC